MYAVVHQCVVRPNGSFLVLARVRKLDSSYVVGLPTSSDFSTITRTTTSLRTGATIQAATSLTVGSVIFASLSTAGGWTRDTTGWNFADLAPSTLVTGWPGSRLTYTFTLAASPYPVFLLDIDAKANTSPP